MTFCYIREKFSVEIIFAVCKEDKICCQNGVLKYLFRALILVFLHRTPQMSFDHGTLHVHRAFEYACCHFFQKKKIY